MKRRLLYVQNPLEHLPISSGILSQVVTRAVWPRAYQSPNMLKSIDHRQQHYLVYCCSHTNVLLYSALHHLQPELCSCWSTIEKNRLPYKSTLYKKKRGGLN